MLMAVATVAQPGRTIVGDWTQQEASAEWSFRSDGTGFMEQGQPNVIARFSWQLEGNVLRVFTAGTSVPYEVLQNDGRVLRIRNQRGGQVYELRKKSGQ